MITTRQFQDAMEQVNKAFEQTFKRLEALEAEVQDLKQRPLTSPEEKPNARKKRPKTS